MKRFNYKARDKETNKIVKGTIQAETEQNAGRLLLDQGLIPTSVIEEGAANPLLKATSRVTTKDRIMFTLTRDAHRCRSATFCLASYRRRADSGQRHAHHR